MAVRTLEVGSIEQEVLEGSGFVQTEVLLGKQGLEESGGKYSVVGGCRTGNAEINSEGFTALPHPGSQAM